MKKMLDIHSEQIQQLVINAISTNNNTQFSPPSSPIKDPVFKPTNTSSFQDANANQLFDEQSERSVTVESKKDTVSEVSNSITTSERASDVDIEELHHPKKIVIFEDTNTALMDHD